MFGLLCSHWGLSAGNLQVFPLLLCHSLLLLLSLLFFIKYGLLSGFHCLALVNLAFTCQMNFFTIYGELQNSNPRRMKKVSYRAMTVCLFLYALMGIFGYVNFRDETQGNIMLNFDVDNPVTTVARLGRLFFFFTSLFFLFYL